MLKRYGDYWYPLSPVNAPYWGVRYSADDVANVIDDYVDMPLSSRLVLGGAILEYLSRES